MAASFRCVPRKARQRPGYLLHDYEHVGSELVQLRSVAELQRRPVVVRLAVRREHEAVPIGDEILLVADGVRLADHFVDGGVFVGKRMDFQTLS